jgi:hypothetical protein
VPAARFHALDGGREAWPGDARIIDAAGCEIEANAANAGLPVDFSVPPRRRALFRPWCDRQIIGRSEAREGRASSGCIALSVQ